MVLASYESSAITFEEYAKQAITFAKSQTEVERRALTDRRIQMLRDDWGPLLKKAMESWYKPEVLDLIMGPGRSELDLTNNPAKHIWQELSVLYKLPPRRSTPKKEGEVDKYNELLEDTDFNLFWQMVELLLNACREVVIWPDVITKGDGKKYIKHRIECGNTMSVIVNPQDKTEIECYIQVYIAKALDGVEHTHYRIWTDKWYGIFEEDSKELNGVKRVDLVDPEVSEEDHFTGQNPYGFMPQVMIRLMDWQDVPWDITSGADVVNLTLTGGRERQNFRYLQKISGFKQGVATGNIDKPPERLLDPAYLIFIPGDDTSFTTIDWSVDLLARQKAEQNDELGVAARYGINPQRFKQSGDYQTSFAAKSAERGLQEQREKIKPILGKAENLYYKSMSSVAKVHKIGKPIPDPEVRLVVDHVPISYPENPIIQADLDAKEISMGVSSPLDVIKRKNPHMTLEQAKDELKRIMEDIAFVNDEKTRHNIADIPATADGSMVQSKSAQENGSLGPLEKAKKKQEQENK
jgi:hypothetical protein